MQEREEHSRLRALSPARVLSPLFVRRARALQGGPRHTLAPRGSLPAPPRIHRETRTRPPAACLRSSSLSLRLCALFFSFPMGDAAPPRGCGAALASAARTLGRRVAKETRVEVKREGKGWARRREPVRAPRERGAVSQPSPSPCIALRPAHTVVGHPAVRHLPVRARHLHPAGVPGAPPGSRAAAGPGVQNPAGKRMEWRERE